MLLLSAAMGIISPLLMYITRARKIDAKYVLFTRKQMLEFLQENIDRGVQEQVFLDYYFYLREIDQKYSSYETLPLSEWKDGA